MHQPRPCRWHHSRCRGNDGNGLDPCRRHSRAYGDDGKFPRILYSSFPRSPSTVTGPAPAVAQRFVRRGDACVALRVGLAACGFPGRRMRRPYGASRPRQPLVNQFAGVPYERESGFEKRFTARIAQDFANANRHGAAGPRHPATGSRYLHPAAPLRPIKPIRPLPPRTRCAPTSPARTARRTGRDRGSTPSR